MLEKLTSVAVAYVKQENFASAANCFARAYAIEPNPPKWGLCQASCDRRLGKYEEAYDMYKVCYIF